MAVEDKIVEKSKKREIIKNIAIIFLSVMLLLTFFSNTILNYSLAEVSTEFIHPGPIQTQVRATGVLELEDPYNVNVTQSRVVASIAAKEGDRVEKGDVLFYLEGTESDELKEAQKELDSAKTAYERKIIESGLTRDDVVRIESGTDYSFAQHQTLLDNEEIVIKMAEADVDKWTAKVDELEAQFTYASEHTSVDTSAENKKVYDATLALNKAMEDLANISKTADPTGYAAQEAVVNEKQRLLDDASAALEYKKGQGGSGNAAGVANELAEAKKALAASKKIYDDLKEGREADKTKILAKLDIIEQLNAIKLAQEKVDKIEKESLGGEILAPVSGTVAEIKVHSGEKTFADGPIAVISMDGDGFRMKTSVSVNQAQDIKPGDPVTVKNSWYYGNVIANLVSVKTDKENPRDKKLLEFSIKGEYLEEGQSMSLVVGKQGSDYDFVVPNSAVREDSDGNFIFVVKSKSTPFGNRYIAKRVDVDILAEDDNNKAVMGGLEGNEYVLTNSSKPVKSGDQVKLAEN